MVQRYIGIMVWKTWNKQMLPKWKQRKYILVLLFLVLSLYDVNERAGMSMALNDNIKKFREEKKSRSATTCR